MLWLFPNALLTQLNSLLLTYSIFRNHLERLGQSLLESTCGVMVNQRIPDYFLHLKPTPLEEDLVASRSRCGRPSWSPWARSA